LTQKTLPASRQAGSENGFDGLWIGFDVVLAG